MTGLLGLVEIQNGRRLLLMDFQHYCQMSSWIQTIDLQSVHCLVLDSETEERDQTWCDFLSEDSEWCFLELLKDFITNKL